MAQNKDIKKIISKLPDTPGVYLFLGTSKRGEGGLRKKKVLYVGKATSLRDRVRSYFNQDIVNTRSPLISKMLSEFDEIEYIKTDSVLEALVLEANLIKKLEPEANIKEKDNRSFNFVVITNEEFPRVLTMRGRELEESRLNLDIKIKYKFGPFPNGSQLKEAMKIVRKMFPFRDKCIPSLNPLIPSPKGRGKQISDTSSFPPSPLGRGQGVGCFNRQIGLCPGVCTGDISQIEYAKQIQNIILFFESNKQKLIKNLGKQMKDFAKAREFEKAQKIKKTLFTLSHIQDISLIKDQVSKGAFDTKNFRIESYDVAHLSGTNMVGVMTVVENREVKKSDYRKFKIKYNSGVNDIKALSEILTRRLVHKEWPMPNLFVVDGGLAQKRAIEKVLRENGVQTPTVSVVKNERHKPKEILADRGALLTKGKKWSQLEREILLSNSEAHRFALSFHKQLRRKF
ncbi:MAG: hypothetical protein A3A96_01365 [Candidatus Zambryskibacteria bacterium RIFCSPLOWO2_01_FULL_39_39]|uniref:Excinuclease ABC subunit C n=1 Tax=Candidatus Zambryskibacteria bacterium RIFCSPLOWO2_01_FULL_39_39 TaxID=1802758 RepID=A0A1G2TZW3_9BACT|nr:MAG: hypothetical protein A2644_03255 [Candidatus Zambryskibacteria bacterium RIFCSPHIGHO2_01_FULL_39_63]OHA95260.1 MAG: hypothetical protein A3B88_03020 [Candidatus Zambryskibacteria bacterium RIFCSPHIGHO2_02_FULL_39_19]OHA98855.1 MAG: hypothetical protein A3F20_02295 [Candidatus Zambryskibacteria bacterium RIFCSPHIGHO2_12_FULL_39_21]OHB02774.1 MAG: hypothetical protein A3A96_01365 [Candidatus Zambryskibacteria bacterium RIFCSPLOWO2_01_FULL_39_39]